MKTPAAALFATLLLVGTAGAQIEPPAAGLGNVATTPVTIGDGSATSTLTADVSGTDCSMVYDGTTWDFSCSVSASSFAADQHATDGASLVLLEGVDDGSNSFTLKVPDSGLASSKVCDVDENGVTSSCLPSHIEPVVLDTPDDTDSYAIFKAPRDLTILSVDCIVDPGGAGESVVIDIRECNSTATSCVTVDATITCDNDGAADDGSLSNATIDSGDWVLVDIGTVTGTVTYVSISTTWQ